jgi:hypothetical protein
MESILKNASNAQTIKGVLKKTPPMQLKAFLY